MLSKKGSLALKMAASSTSSTAPPNVDGVEDDDAWLYGGKNNFVTDCFFLD